jgi:hypothetical protein
VADWYGRGVIARLLLVFVLLGAPLPTLGDPLPLPVAELTVKDDAVEPIIPKWRAFKMRSGTRYDPFVHIVPPALGSAGDPTLHGGVLTIFNVGGPPQVVTYPLPAERWRLIGTPENFKGYHFHDDTPADGPIVRVFVKPEKLFVSGGKTNWTYLLGPVPQGTIAVRFALGADEGWCVEAPAKPPFERFDTPARFAGSKGAIPASCTPVR